jgi:hypothetical protein
MRKLHSGILLPWHSRSWINKDIKTVFSVFHAMEPYVICGGLLALILLVLYLRRSRKHRASAFFYMITAAQKNKGRDFTQTNSVFRFILTLLGFNSPRAADYLSDRQQRIPPASERHWF